ncbi:MAG: ribosome maturation factor RimP [Epulopiscium sp.]|nr:ribosome maturation factor RimP [Candidatus Epulonipiscium sp.]
MSRKNIESIVAKYLEPIVAEYNYELVDIEYIKEGPNWYLRIYIDKPGGITIDDCEKTSRALEEILDEKDPIEGAYILEVSSPGLDRPLKKAADFKRNIGKIIDIKLYTPHNNQKEYQGKLDRFEDNMVTIITEEDEAVSFKLKDIAIAKPAIIF